MNCIEKILHRHSYKIILSAYRSFKYRHVIYECSNCGHRYHAKRLHEAVRGFPTTEYITDEQAQLVCDRKLEISWITNRTAILDKVLNKEEVYELLVKLLVKKNIEERSRFDNERIAAERKRRSEAPTTEIRWNKVDPENLPVEVVLSKNKVNTGFFIGSLQRYYDPTVNKVICHSGEEGRYAWRYADYYIPLTELSSLLKEE